MNSTLTFLALLLAAVIILVVPGQVRPITDVMGR